MVFNRCGSLWTIGYPLGFSFLFFLWNCLMGGAIRDLSRNRTGCAPLCLVFLFSFFFLISFFLFWYSCKFAGHTGTALGHWMGQVGMGQAGTGTYWFIFFYFPKIWLYNPQYRVFSRLTLRFFWYLTCPEYGYVRGGSGVPSTALSIVHTTRPPSSLLLVVRSTEYTEYLFVGPL